MKKEQISLKQLYELEKNKPRPKIPSPAALFIKEIAELTHKNENAVRCWISGRQKPDYLVIKVIADKFGVDPDYLFPNH